MTELTAEQVRKEVADWVDGAWDPDLTLGEWWKRLAASGYSHPMLPEDCGGKGYPRDLAQAVNHELSAHHVVGPPGGLGVMLAAPTIAVHGDEYQKSTFIPRILDGTDAWCQLFSEPAAGSDLAGLQCKAELDGDEYVITGQKVWTSGGQVADWGMLLARTDPDATKHAGISYFAFDMHQPGVDVRPLREMTGRAMFNEVFIDEARVAVVDLIGGLNNGWAVANTTLAVERASLGSSGGAALATVMPGSITNQFSKRAGDLLKSEDAVEAASAVGSDTLSMLRALAADRGLDTDPVVRQGLAEIYTLSQLNRWNVSRARSKQRSTGVEPNLAKLLGNITLRHTREIANHIIGAEGTLWGPDTLSGGAIQEMTVFSPGPSIYGGSDQIQRNIISERGLGLPKEPGDLKGVAFKDLPKNV